MQTIKNVLAAIGLAVVAIGLIGLAQSSGIIGQLKLSNAVTQQVSQPQTVYIVATPTAAPVQPITEPPALVTAVPIITNAVQPAPVQPTPIAADDFAAACAAGQAAGRRVSPNCPPRAGQPLTVAGPMLTYCYQGDGWTPEYRAIVADGFNAWAATGITFVEDAENCQTAVVLTTDGSNHAGHGGMGLIDFNLTYGLLPQAAVHEVGHILGLTDSNAGAMNGVYQLGAPVVYPTVAEIATVRQMWGME